MIQAKKLSDINSGSIPEDGCFGPLRDYSRMLDTRALAVCGNIEFVIEDPFAVYLSATTNRELYSFLRTKSDEIREFISEMESRVKVTP